MRKCSMAGCERKYNGKGYCSMHAFRVRKYGDPEMRKHMRGENRTKHPLINVYRNMLGRCNSETNKAYKYYGGRGIKVCERWQGLYGFTHFLEDMGERPEGYTIDRIDNDGDYSPENCKWATRKEQTSNRRKLQANNTSGHVGVSWYKNYSKWLAHKTVNRKLINLGYYDRIEDAIKARQRADKELFDETTL